MNNYESLQVMINKLQDNHIDIDSANREEQIRSFHYGGLDATSSFYIIVNKKNKVIAANKMGRAILYYAGGVDCTSLCC